VDVAGAEACPALEQPDAGLDETLPHMHARGSGVQEDMMVQEGRWMLQRRCLHAWSHSPDLQTCAFCTPAPMTASASYARQRAAEPQFEPGAGGYRR
jgi:hypothetical protein